MTSVFLALLQLIRSDESDFLACQRLECNPWVETAVCLQDLILTYGREYIPNTHLNSILWDTFGREKLRELLGCETA